MKASIDAKFNAAIAEALLNEQNPPVQGRVSICDLITAIKEDLDIQKTALEELEAILNCGQ